MPKPIQTRWHHDYKRADQKRKLISWTENFTNSIRTSTCRRRFHVIYLRNHENQIKIFIVFRFSCNLAYICNDMLNFCHDISSKLISMGKRISFIHNLKKIVINFGNKFLPQYFSIDSIQLCTL